MNSILHRIAEEKISEVSRSKQSMPLSRLLDAPMPPIWDFIQALETHDPAIIAEIKRASPSKGIIRADFDVGAIAEAYETNGASCLSVLTDESFFQGHASYIATAKAHTMLPVLRKDFIIDPYQIYESRYLGADCILLIIALLDFKQSYDLCQLAQELGMAVLVESHTHEELEQALQLPTRLMGINNRSLHTFETNLQCAIDLSQYVPKQSIVISESGIEHHQDIITMRSHGITTFLVGEHLMRSENIGKSLYQLIHGKAQSL